MAGRRRRESVFLPVYLEDDGTMHGSFKIEEQETELAAATGDNVPQQPPARRSRRSSLLAPLAPRRERSPSLLGDIGEDNTAAQSGTVAPSVQQASGNLRGRRDSARVMAAFDERVTSSLYDSGTQADVATTSSSSSSSSGFSFRGKRMSLLFDAKDFVQRNAKQEQDHRDKLAKVRHTCTNTKST